MSQASTLLYSTHPPFLAFLSRYLRKDRLLLFCIITLQIFLSSRALAESSTPEIKADDNWTSTELDTIKGLILSDLQLKVEDSSNHVLNNTQSIKLGKSLFNEKGLSHNGKVSCASCHLKKQAFTDNKLVAIGVNVGIRNTPTLLNASQQDWFFWDGRKDSLWAQALSSLENPAEHNFSRTEVFHYINKNEQYKKPYETIFGKVSFSGDDSSLPKVAGPNGNLKALKAWKKLSPDRRKATNQLFTNIGKAIASYVSTIKSEPSQFDQFAEALLKNGHSSLFSASEKKGLKLFISQKGSCVNCHSTAVFSNKDFHNIGTGIQAKDNGRSEVIEAVIHDPFNCLGPYSDAKPEQCLELKYVKKDRHALAGNFKTPTLRSISKTAPYMHDGRYNTLKEVLNHYSTITKNKAFETDLPKISFTLQEQQALVSFLLTL